MKLGKAKYGTGKTTFKIQDGDNVFRILPPMGKLAESGKWHQYYRVEWGYKNSAGKNRPFQDVRVVNYDTKMVDVESAAHLRREALKTKLETVTAEFRKDPTNEVLKKQHTELKELVKRFNLDSKYYLNAIDLNGKIGLLKIGSRAFKALKAEIDKLRKQGVDPLSVDNGRFFNFHRSNETGNFQDVAYQITVYQESVEVNGEVYRKDKIHKIDQSIISRLSDESFELSGMYPEVTATQVERMVKEGTSAVDEILGSGSRIETEESETDSEEGDGVPSTTAVSVSNTTTTLTNQSLTKADLTVAPSVAATPQTPPVVAEKTTAASSSMNTDEFLKIIGAL